MIPDEIYLEDDLKEDPKDTYLVQKYQEELLRQQIRPLMEWKVFGDKHELTIGLSFRLNWFRRFMCWLCLGSRFKKI